MTTKPLVESEVLLETPASYHWLVILTAAIAPVLLIVLIVLSALGVIASEDSVAALIASLLLVVTTFALVFPTKFRVLSKGVVVVQTVSGLSYPFGHVTSAHREHGIGVCYIKFATDLRRRVVVERESGYWTLLVSPLDVERFIDAVQRSATA